MFGPAATFLLCVLGLDGGGEQKLVPEGPALLAQADRLRALASGRPELLARSERLEARARARLFDVDGRPAAGPQTDVGDVERGAEGGARGAMIVAETDRPWRRSLRFRPGEPAFVYLRARSPRPVVLRVTDAAGGVVCRESSQQGRALCGWRPTREQTVVVEVDVTAGSDTPLDLFVN